ncbi:MAG TPA: DUF507 family protein [Desulfobacteraceae bacterium]|nr:DUF507 family protein [Desulfobacteraceae bacterium]
MKRFYSGKDQERILNRLERLEKREALQRDRFFKFKLPEIHNRLSQVLLMEKIIETESPKTVSDLILKGLKQALKANEFEFKYFIAPIRDLVPNPNPISLYMTQYVLEVMINDPNVIEIYGTDLDIYSAINSVITQINMKFEKTEEEILEQLSRNRSLMPGSREYDIALEQMFYKKMGEPQKV